MRFSFKTAQQETTWSDLLAFWKEAEQIDVYAAGWAFDHFYPLRADPALPCMDGWSVLAALAAKTSRLRLGLMVGSNTYRHPAVLANIAATVDIISDGRLELGIGAGWFEDEHAAYGIDLPLLKERFDRFDEALESLHLLLTRPTADFEGRYYQLRQARCEPKPLQEHLPIVIGGKGEKRTLWSTARWADQYNYPSYDIEDFRRKIDVLHGHCADLGRDPAEIEISIQIKFDDAQALGDMAADAVAAGADHVIAYFAPPHDIRLLEPVAESLRNLG